MTGNEILQADMLDILFDNRNKDYGAYRLRKFYTNRLILSLGIALGSVLLLFLLFNTSNSRSAIAENRGAVILRDYTLPPEKQKIEVVKPKTSMASAPAASQRKYVNVIEIVDDNKLIDDKLNPNSDFNDFIPSGTNLDGVPGTGTTPGPINTSGGGTGTDLTAKANSDAPLINSAPEFPGGIQAWLRFLSKNLRVPGELEAGEKKTVLIRFEVATDGSVTGFEVVQSGGKYYDEEVIRVLRKMPKWKPALQSSQPVAVGFTQPVTFMGVED